MSRQLFPLFYIVGACELRSLHRCDLRIRIESLRLANSHRKSATCEFTSQFACLRDANSHHNSHRKSTTCKFASQFASLRGSSSHRKSQVCEVRPARSDLRICIVSRKSALSHYLCWSVLMTSSINLNDFTYKVGLISCLLWNSLPSRHLCRRSHKYTTRTCLIHDKISRFFYMNLLGSVTWFYPSKK